MERLDKIIASQGIGTRSEVRKMIWSGKVTVDGVIERRIDIKLDPSAHDITVNGSCLSYRKHLYIMMNKPSGVVSASNDSHVHTVIDILPSELKRSGLFPVGRLDKDTEGLLIITDDGDFAHSITSPSKKVYKTYHAYLDDIMDDADMEKLRSGIVIDGDEKCLPAQVAELDRTDFLYEIKICEGKYHQVKRMAQAVGRRVLRLERVAVGGLVLDSALERGESRELSREEMDILTRNV